GGASGGADLGPTGQGGSCEASMYSEPQPTASGERFDPSAMTAAHKTLPMDTMVEVTNPDNGTSVTVRINDRGPYIAGRCLDLSTASFEQIASASAGVVDVRWQVLS
ncbi:septal ring lytic transglycosylase RlpA family protein, partial [Streptomonospora algeriensis]